MSKAAASAPRAAEPLVLLDDEDTRIELHRASPQPAAVLTLTFDPLMYLWPRPAFAADFVRRLGSDAVAVRRKHEHFYQPLSRAAFEAAVRPVLAHYRHVVAYGSSLGAYAALYYARDLEALVLAPSPRVSVHPVHGHPSWQRQALWQHERLNTGPRARCRAWIYWDPRDAQDQRYVEQELQPTFGHGLLQPVPFSGHPTTQFLGDLGHLKALVQAALADQPPPPLERRAVRARVATYWQVLGEHALRRSRLALASKLLARSLALRPRNTVALRAQGDLALRQGDLVAAAAALHAALDVDPNDTLARHLLTRCEAAVVEGTQPPSASAPQVPASLANPSTPRPVPPGVQQPRPPLQPGPGRIRRWLRRWLRALRWR